jgi:hypothetical protein
VKREGSAGGGPNTFLVERYVPGITSDQFAAAERRIRRAVRDLAGSGELIRLVSSTLIPAEETVLSVFDASGEEAVIEANLRGGVHVDRVQPVELTGAEGQDRATGRRRSRCP